MNSKNIFSLICGLIVTSLLVTGVLSDRYGRKRLVVIKGLVMLGVLSLLIVFGFVGHLFKEAVIGIYFISLSFATLTFDISLLGFESMPHQTRENFIVIV
jgi:MFS family permease